MEHYIKEEYRIMHEQDRKKECLTSECLEQTIEDTLLQGQEVFTIDKSKSVQDAIHLLLSKKISSVLITDNKVLVGIFTERDVLRKVLGNRIDLKSTPITDYMTNDPRTLYPEDKMSFIMHNMHFGGYRHIPIVDKDHKPLACISIEEIVKFIRESFPQAVLNLPAEPFRGEPSREGA